MENQKHLPKTKETKILTIVGVIIFIVVVVIFYLDWIGRKVY